MKPDKSVHIYAVLMDDRRVEPTREQFRVLVDAVAADNVKRKEAGLPLAAAISEDGRSKPIQDDKNWYGIFDNFFEKFKKTLKFTEESGGTGYNVIEALKALLGADAKSVNIRMLPMTEKHAIGYVVVHPDSKEGYKAATRPDGDIDYTHLDPKSGLGKELAATNAFAFIKSVTNKHKEGTEALLKFMKEHNPNAPIIALMNGSDKPENPKFFLAANIWFATKAEIQRPEYNGIREEFFKKKDFLLVLMDGDSGENGYHIVTPDNYRCFPPANVVLANSAGARDGAAAPVIADAIGKLNIRFFAPYNLDAIGNLASVMAGEIMKRKETTMPKDSYNAIAADYDSFVAEQIRNRKLVRDFCSSLTPQAANV